jgi:hypothetical protein
LVPKFGQAFAAIAEDLAASGPLDLVLGIDPEYDNQCQPLPIAHDDCSAIKELLS